MAPGIFRPPQVIKKTSSRKPYPFSELLSLRVGFGGLGVGDSYFEIGLQNNLPRNRPVILPAIRLAIRVPTLFFRTAFTSPSNRARV